MFQCFLKLCCWKAEYNFCHRGQRVKHLCWNILSAIPHLYVYGNIGQFEIQFHPIAYSSLDNINFIGHRILAW